MDARLRIEKGGGSVADLPLESEHHLRPYLAQSPDNGRADVRTSPGDHGGLAGQSF